MLDIIKEYLVSLGFQTDNASFSAANKTIDKLDKKVVGLATGATKQFAIAGMALTTFLATANLGIAKYLQGLAKADLENEKFARRMWMSKDNATAYKNSLSALGADVQDLYLSPELLQRYKQLRQQAGEMAAPAEFGTQMKQIRDITFEFQRLKLEGMYALQWIGYYLFKYLETPIKQVKTAMKNLNDSLSKGMPQWTEKVARVLSWVVRLGSAAIWGLGKVKDAFNSLSPATKTAGLAITGFMGLLSMGPIGWIIAGLTALLLLLDDYKTYQEGGQSLFGDSWAKLDEFKKKLEENGVLDRFRESLDNISKSLKDIFKWFGEISKKLLNMMGFEDFEDFVSTVLMDSLNSLDSVLWSISKALESIDKLLSGDFEGAFFTLNEAAGKLVDEANPFEDLTNEDSFLFRFGENITKMQWGEETGAKAAQGVKEDFQALRNWRDGVRESIKSWIKGLFSPHAEGGILTSPHMGLVAEDGPEAIIPLNPKRRQNALNLLAQTAGILGSSVSNTGTSMINYYNVTNSPNYTIYGNEPMATAKAVDRTVDYGQLIRNFRGVYQ